MTGAYEGHNKATATTGEIEELCNKFEGFTERNLPYQGRWEGTHECIVPSSGARFSALSKASFAGFVEFDKVAMYSVYTFEFHR